MAIVTSDSINFFTSIQFIFELNLIRMQLKQESLIIVFILILTIWILFISASSKEIIMLTFDYVKRRPLISNQFFELSVSKAMLGASVKQAKLEVNAIEPRLEVLPVPLDINEQTVRVNLLRWRNDDLKLLDRSYNLLDVDVLSLPDPLELGLLPLFLLQLLKVICQIR